MSDEEKTLPLGQAPLGEDKTPSHGKTFTRDAGKPQPSEKTSTDDEGKISPSEKAVVDEGKDPPAEKTPLGRAFKGQRFAPATSVEAIDADKGERAQYEDPDAIPLMSYLLMKGFRDPVMQASMMAFTSIRSATVKAWDEIFATH